MVVYTVVTERGSKFPFNRKQLEGGTVATFLLMVTGSEEKTEEAERWCEGAEAGSVYEDDGFRIEVAKSQKRKGRKKTS